MIKAGSGGVRAPGEHRRDGEKQLIQQAHADQVPEQARPTLGKYSGVSAGTNGHEHVGHAERRPFAHGKYGGPVRQASVHPPGPGRRGDKERARLQGRVLGWNVAGRGGHDQFLLGGMAQAATQVGEVGCSCRADLSACPRTRTVG